MSRWARGNFPQYENLTVAQVEAMGGKFYCPASPEVAATDPSASWFVPSDINKPCMVKQHNGFWRPRGF